MVMTNTSFVYLIFILATVTAGVKESYKQIEQDEKMRRFLIGPILATKFSKINEWIDKFFTESGLSTALATNMNKTGLEARFENIEQKTKNIQQQIYEIDEKISVVANNISDFGKNISDFADTKFQKIQEWLDQIIKNIPTTTTPTITTTTITSKPRILGNVTIGESLYEKIEISKDAWGDMENLISSKETSLTTCASLCSKTENCHSFQYMEESFADNCRLGTCHRKMFEYQQGSSETVEVFVSDHISQQYILSGDPWRLVRHVPEGIVWHPATDGLLGTDVYGDPKNMEKPFSIKFGDFNQFLFETEDLTMWLIVNKTELIGENGEKFYDYIRIPVIASSKSCSPYTPIELRRKGFVEDPWVSVEDHPKKNIYIEGSYDYGGYKKSSTGFNVFVRKV